MNKIYKNRLIGGFRRVIVLCCALWMSSIMAFLCFMAYTNSSDMCKICIETLEIISKELHCTYEALNVYLFIIIEPALIIVLAVTTYLALYHERSKPFVKVIYYCTVFTSLYILTVLSNWIIGVGFNY